MCESEILSKEFILKWSNKQIKDIDKFFLYNEERNEQFLNMSKDFIESLKDDSD